MVPPANVNLLAVVAAAVASMVIGFLWYSPFLFGKMWMELSGMSKAKLGKEKSKGMMPSYLATFVGSLVTGYVLAHVISYTQSATIMDGAVAGFWLWLGFVATVSLGMVLWEGKPIKLYILKNAHQLVSLMVMGAILATWV